MNLAVYINDLLYRYDCVIVPDFGGFVTNRIHTILDVNTQVFYPPSKKISFNTLLNHNDGLLTNYIASLEKMSFNDAVSTIKLEVAIWKKTINKSGFVELPNIGKLILNTNNQIEFEPVTNVNYLTESFGLSEIEKNLIIRNNTKVKTIQKTDKISDNKTIPLFIRYAAGAAILISLGVALFKGYKNTKHTTILANQEKGIENKIQKATFIISNPLPTIELNIIKEVDKPYHIIAGAFQFAENAEKKMKKLQAKGFKSEIIGLNKWGLTQVTFASYSDKNEAINSLYKIQKTISKEAWLLVKQ